jgi:uncharacterized protein (DUF983 family)
MTDNKRKSVSLSVIRRPSSILRCPCCGKGKLYDGLLKVVDACAACGLSFKNHEQGDGPAFFAITFVGALIAIAASIVEIKYEPPFWLHAALWIPLICILSVLSLRFAKAAIISLQYARKPEDFC